MRVLIVDDHPIIVSGCAAMLAGDWSHPYTREQAAFPVARLRTTKVWPPVRRIDGAYGDRNLVCACPPIEAFAEA